MESYSKTVDEKTSQAIEGRKFFSPPENVPGQPGPTGYRRHWIRPTFHGRTSEWLATGHAACISGVLSAS